MAINPTNKRVLDPVTFLYTGQITSEDVYHVRSKGNMIVKPLVIGSSNAGGLKVFGNQQVLPSSREYDRYTIGVKFPGDVETATFHVSKDGGSTYYGANHWTVVGDLEVVQQATLAEEHLKVDPVKINESAYGYTYIVKKASNNELRFAYVDNVQDTTTSYFIENSDKNFIRHARVTKLDNRLICAHYDSTSPVEVHFKVSDDNGTSWAELAILSDDNFDNERRFGIVGGKSTIWALIPKTDDMYLYQSLNDATSFSQFGVFKSGMPDSKCTNVDMHFSETSKKYHVAQASDSTGMTIWESDFGNNWTGKVTLEDTYVVDSSVKIPLAFCEFEDHTLELLFKSDTTTSYNAYTRNFNRGTGAYDAWSSNTERVLQIQNTGDFFDNIGLLVHQGIIHFYGNAIDQSEAVSDLVHLQFQNRSEATFENEYANSYYPSFGLPDDVGGTAELTGGSASINSNSDLLLDATTGNISYRFSVPEHSTAPIIQARWRGATLNFRAKVQDHNIDGQLFLDTDLNYNNNSIYFSRFYNGFDGS